MPAASAGDERAEDAHETRRRRQTTAMVSANHPVVIDGATAPISGPAAAMTGHGSRPSSIATWHPGPPGIPDMPTLHAVRQRGPALVEVRGVRPGAAVQVHEPPVHLAREGVLGARVLLGIKRRAGRVEPPQVRQATAAPGVPAFAVSHFREASGPRGRAAPSCCSFHSARS